MTEARSLRLFPVHLGLGAKALPQPEFTGLQWYEDYAGRTAGDGREGRLVAMHDFSDSWTSWEMHPDGDEVVICTAGTMTLIQETAGGSEAVTLRPGEFAINSAGTWHTADIEREASALFITAGRGTQHRPR